MNHRSRFGALLFAGLSVSGCKKPAPAAPAVAPVTVKVDKARLHTAYSAGVLGYVNGNGEMVIPQKFSFGGAFADGLAPVLMPDNYDGHGYIDTTGKLVVPLQFVKAESFEGGVARVARDFDHPDLKRLGVELAEGTLLPAELTTFWGLIDKTGKPLTAFEYTSIEPFSEGVALAKFDFGSVSRRAFLDTSGHVVQALAAVLKSSEDWQPFGDGVACTRHAADAAGNVTTCYDHTGKAVVQSAYNVYAPFSEGLARAAPQKFDGKYGFIDKTGKLAIPAHFVFEDSFTQGLAGACFEQGPNKCGYIDRSGKMTIQPAKFARPYPFHEGFASVCRQLENSNWVRFYIDQAGHVLGPEEFDSSFSCGGADAPVEGGIVITRDGVREVTGKYVWKPAAP
jgi:hypothetical protein